jgi:hypothetical protein
VGGRAPSCGGPPPPPHSISEQTHHRWKAKYGRLDVNDALFLKALDDENRRLKAAVADLDNKLFMHNKREGMYEIPSQVNEYAPAEARPLRPAAQVAEETCPASRSFHTA